MNLFFDSLWRAAVYCLQPRLVLLSLLPLVVMIGLTVTLFYFFWESGIASMQSWLSQQALLDNALRWLETMGAGSLRMVIAPLLVVMCTLPLIIITTLLLVTWFMTPAIVTLVANRRFAQMERHKGGSWWRGVAWGAGAALLALLGLIVSSPLWLIPPLVMILPPLIWGWLTYQVMTYDVLADHASAMERAQLKREHRWPLLSIGVLAGFLGATPALMLGFGMTTIVMFPLLVPLAIWIYTLVFAFSALWFTHYCLGALHAMRLRRPMESVLVINESGDVE